MNLLAFYLTRAVGNFNALHMLSNVWHLPVPLIDQISYIYSKVIQSAKQ